MPLAKNYLKGHNSISKTLFKYLAQHSVAAEKRKYLPDRERMAEKNSFENNKIF